MATPPKMNFTPIDPCTSDLGTLNGLSYLVDEEDIAVSATPTTPISPKTPPKKCKQVAFISTLTTPGTCSRIETAKQVQKILTNSPNLQALSTTEAEQQTRVPNHSRRRLEMHSVRTQREKAGGFESINSP